MKAAAAVLATLVWAGTAQAATHEHFHEREARLAGAIALERMGAGVPFVLPAYWPGFVARKHAHAMLRNGYYGSALKFGGKPFVKWARRYLPFPQSIGTLRWYRCGRGATVNWLMGQVARSPFETSIMLLPAFQMIGVHWIAFDRGPGFWKGKGRCHLVVAVFSGILP